MRAFLAHLVFFALVVLAAGCTAGADRQRGQWVGEQTKPSIKRLAGDIGGVPPAEVMDKGKVMMSYSDCATCHKADDRKRGPAFHDIAARYPMNSTYIYVLAKRVILGAKGSWGSVVMPPHPTISEEEAKTMVMYILSLDPAD